jgi:Rab3 GTPase-activating protein catalytic subunit
MASTSSSRYAKHRRIGEDDELEEVEEEAEEEVFALLLPLRLCS